MVRPRSPAKCQVTTVDPLRFAIREVSEIRCPDARRRSTMARIRLTFSGFAVSDWQNATA